jgi:hypothetical protein
MSEKYKGIFYASDDTTPKIQVPNGAFMEHENTAENGVCFTAFK